MSPATFDPIQGSRPSGADSDSRPRPGLSGMLRAVKIFAATAVSVVVLGDYAEDAGVIRH
ncbi:hypothetical protein OG444_17685 [Streptomyces sp. NBC_01232]|uniref:hypothetical protein n=1 Tax=Streptomyces sp. NBC_01232 TaxID=2903786 RepID=UPI002E15590B|nr:hypothetical protein OG444_17685 [Streptomyces sp. NBC_01232]